MKWTAEKVKKKECYFIKFGTGSIVWYYVLGDNYVIEKVKKDGIRFMIGGLDAEEVAELFNWMGATVKKDQKVA